MAAPLATCAEEEPRIEGVKPIEIHRRMKVQYGGAYLSLQQVCEWTEKFMNSISSVTGCPRPGQAHRVVVTPVVKGIVKENHLTVNETAAHLDMCHGSAHHIVNDFLQLHKYLKFNKFINT
jgi:cobalamin biosynthesis Co2+ chelatase CbiK